MSPASSPALPPAQQGAAASWFEPDAPPPLDPAIAGSPLEGQPPVEVMPFETAALPDVAPGSRDAPPFWEPEPTQLLDAADLAPAPAPQPAPPAQPFSGSVFGDGTDLLPGAVPAAGTPPASPPPTGEASDLSALDMLFGESQFREYDNRPDPAESPFARRPAPPAGAEPGAEPGAPAGPPPGISRLQKILLIVLGSLLAVLALVALFFLGVRLPDLLGPAPAVVAPSASPSPSPSPVVAVGPVEPGEYLWDELLGGECLDPFESPWEVRFTVVDCAVPHAAQLVRVGEFATPEGGPEPYPGEEQLQATALDLCRAAGIYSAAAGALTDAQVSVSYPVGAEAWDAGDRRYACFVTRTSGEPITGDIALPQPTPTPDPAP